MIVKPVRALKDNYCYLVETGGILAVVDPSEAAPVVAALGGRRLTQIWNTHHHHDHVGGNLELAARFPGCEIFCSVRDFDRVPGATRGFRDGEEFAFGAARVRVIAIPGHTEGQIAFHIGDDLFVGDTVFEMGCGRLFEGTPAQMFASLQKITRLPAQTRLHFGHEYAETNARFSLQVEPANASAIKDRLAHVRAELARDGVSHAPTIAQESLVNPFFRARDVATFTDLRLARNTFQ